MANPEELESAAGVDVGADINGGSIPCRDTTQTDGQVRTQSNSFMFACTSEALNILSAIWTEKKWCMIYFSLS